ncbi:low affinity iron permease family protein [Agrobacterium vitis]|uniref:low affinity iron permease family protein n=1 Tax=Agrobacterium vitis TaxID=373 RepID=UPI00307D1DC7
MINTGTTIIAFLMVFLIQNTQNRDEAALQTKLDEIILSSDAENEFIGIEKLTDTEHEALHLRCEKSPKRSQAILQRTRAEPKASKNES